MSAKTLQRQWALLRAIPERSYRKAGDLHQALLDEGYEVDKRTVERDLQELAKAFPIQCNARSKPYGWRWERGAKVLDIPGMDPATALTFKMVEAFLEPLMPRSTLNHLQRYFSHADDVLAKTKNPLKSWLDKVQIIPRGQRLQQPAIDPEILQVVYDALLSEQRFHARYRRKDGSEREYVVNPQGLVLRDQTAYLVATLRDYQDPVQLVLHRFSKVELVHEPITRIPDFDLSAYIRDHAFDYPEGEDIRLELLFAAPAAGHLAETPLSDDQRWQPQADGRVRITATVADTQQLRWWLLGFGDQVEVIAPQSLREEFARIAQRLASRYATTTPEPEHP